MRCEVSVRMVCEVGVRIRWCATQPKANASMLFTQAIHATCILPSSTPPSCTSCHAHFTTHFDARIYFTRLLRPTSTLLSTPDLLMHT